MFYSVDTKANKSGFYQCNNNLRRFFYLQSITKQFFITVKLKLKRKDLFSLIQFLKEIQKQKNCSLAYNINTVHNIQRKGSYFSLLIYIGMSNYNFYKHRKTKMKNKLRLLE